MEETHTKDKKIKKPNRQMTKQKNLKANVTYMVRQDTSLLTVILQRRSRTQANMVKEMKDENDLYECYLSATQSDI